MRRENISRNPRLFAIDIVGGVLATPAAARSRGRPEVYVCSCNVFTDKDVKAVSAEAGQSVAAVYRCLGCRPRCGGCARTIGAILAQVRAEMGCACAEPCPEESACPAVEKAVALARIIGSSDEAPAR